MLDFTSAYEKKILLNNINIEDGFLRDIVYPNEAKGSLSVFERKVKSKKKSEKPLSLNLSNIIVDGLRYSSEKNNKKRVDFNHIKGVVEKLQITGPQVNIITDSLSVVDVYGLDYKKVKTNFSYTLHGMNFKNTQVFTDNSSINAEVFFKYNTKDLKYFTTKVLMDATVKNSYVHAADIKKLYKILPVKTLFNVDANAKGYLNDLSLSHLNLISSDSLFQLNGGLNLKNIIKDRDSVSITSKAFSLKTTAPKIKEIIPLKYSQKIPMEKYDLKEIYYAGEAEITQKEVKLSGALETNLLVTDLVTKIKNEEEVSFDIKLQNGKLKPNAMWKGIRYANFQGTGIGNIKSDTIHLRTKGKLNSIKYNKTRLSKINFDIIYTNDSLKALVNGNDSNLSFNASLEKKQKQKNKDYELLLNLHKARLDKLFPGHISYQKNIAGKADFVLSSDRDKTTMTGKVDSMFVKTVDDEIYFPNMDVNYVANDSLKKVDLFSEKMVALKANGNFNFLDIEKLVNNALNKFVPGNKRRTRLKKQELDFSLTVSPDFLKSITDQLKIRNNMTMVGSFSSEEDKGTLQAFLPSLTVKGVEIDSLKLNLDNGNQFINTNITSRKVKVKNQVYRDISILGKKLNDTLYVRSDFSGKQLDNTSTLYITSNKKTIGLGIEDIKIEYLDHYWINQKDKENKIEFDTRKKEWNFNDLAFKNQDQELLFSGKIKNRTKEKDLKLSLKYVEISSLLPTIDSLSLSGIASGEIYFQGKGNVLRPKGNCKIKNFIVNKTSYGTLFTNITPKEEESTYKLKFSLKNKRQKNINAKGIVKIDEQNFLNSDFNLNVVLERLKLNSLSSLGRNILSKIRGDVSGVVNAKGKINDLNLYGELSLVEAGLNFPYLNIDYDLADNSRISLNGKKITLFKTGLIDTEFKTKGDLYGEMSFDKFNNWYLDLNVAAKNLLVLNTDFKEEVKYYGTAFFNGTAKIKGPTTDLQIDVSGKTLKNTHFVLPLSDVATVEENKFIYYKSYDENSEENELLINKEEEYNSGVSISLDIDVTKEALGEVVIDQASGSALSGRADGRLFIEIDKLLNISMYGDLAVYEGVYDYKYGGVINKPFEVKRGGTISWSGDPYKAILNIEAVHSVKANPKVLLENLPVNRKVDVDLTTHVTGELFDSRQAFAISIPNVSSTINQELDFIINSDENTKMRQFFSLLVSKSFYDENQRESTGSVISSTTSEIVSRAITDIFNKSDDKFYFDFDYTSADRSNIESVSANDQIDIGLATEINDRILINGNLGVPVGETSQSSLVGEVKVEFLINKPGTFRSTFFNRQNEIQFSQEEQGYTQGIGLSYQMDFSNLREFLYKLRLVKGKPKQDAIKEEEQIEISDNLKDLLPD